MDYQQDIRIDQSALDVEWLQQAQLTFQYGEHLAKMKRIGDRKKEALDLVKAELDSKIRKNPDRYGIDKLTEGAIQAALLKEEDYQEINAELIDARYEIEVAFAAVNAIASKKSALENLVRLNGQNYFAGPSIPRDLTQEWERAEKTKSGNKAVAESLQRRKK